MSIVCVCFVTYASQWLAGMIGKSLCNSNGSSQTSTRTDRCVPDFDCNRMLGAIPQDDNSCFPCTCFLSRTLPGGHFGVLLFLHNGPHHGRQFWWLHNTLRLLGLRLMRGNISARHRYRNAVMVDQYRSCSCTGALTLEGKYGRNVPPHHPDAAWQCRR